MKTGYKTIKGVLCIMGIITVIGSFFGCKKKETTETDNNVVTSAVQTTGQPTVQPTDQPAVQPTDQPAGQMTDLLEFRYSPGYSDMDGENHQEVLKKDEEGTWRIFSRNRKSIDEPSTETVYAVSEEDVAGFADFIREKNVISLVDREESDDFITDYSAWNFNIVCAIPDESRASGFRRQIYSFGEYKQYSDKDYELIKELMQKFAGIYGEKISEVITDD